MDATNICSAFELKVIIISQVLYGIDILKKPWYTNNNYRRNIPTDTQCFKRHVQTVWSTHHIEHYWNNAGKSAGHQSRHSWVRKNQKLHFPVRILQYWFMPCSDHYAFSSQYTWYTRYKSIELLNKQILILLFYINGSLIYLNCLTNIIWYL